LLTEGESTDGTEGEFVPDNNYETLDYMLSNEGEVIFWDEEMVEFVNNGINGETNYIIMLDDSYIPITASPMGHVEGEWSH
jgi:hypothetical protein